MEISIQEVESTVQTYDAQALLSPRTMAAIVRAVMAAIEQRDEHRERVAAETQVGSATLS